MKRAQYTGQAVVLNGNQLIIKRLSFFFCFWMLSITGIAQYSFDDDTIEIGVAEWLADSGEATVTYGAISTWDVSLVTDMSGLFQNTSFNDDISDWDVSLVTNMNAMFRNTPTFDQDIGNWNVSRVTTMSRMFDNAAVFNQNIGSWDVGIVTEMQRMFRNSLLFNKDIGNWNVSGVTKMNDMFNNSPAFNQDIGIWDVSIVTDMSGMFSGAHSFDKDIGSWDVSSVTDMSGMFNTAFDFNKDIGSWDVSIVMNMNGMFQSAQSFSQDLSQWCVTLIPADPGNFGNTGGTNPTWNECPGGLTDSDIQTAVNQWVSDEAAATATYGDISNWNTSAVTDMSNLFESKTTFNDDISAWDVSGVTTMVDMFSSAESFNQPLSTWDVSSVTNMTNMLDNSALSVDNYDATLNAWALLTVQPNVTLGADGLTYCAGETARQSLIDTHSWTIDDGSANCSAMTINDFMYGQQVGSELFITELFQKAINHLNSATGANPPSTLMDFLKGAVVNNEIYMEYDLQAIVDAINAGGDILGCTQDEFYNYSETATVDDGSCCPTISTLVLISANSGCPVNDGAIYISVNDDEPSTPYTVTWSGPNNFSSQTEDLTGLESGSYSVTITDDNSCNATETFDVAQHLCFGDGDS